MKNAGFFLLENMLSKLRCQIFFNEFMHPNLRINLKIINNINCNLISPLKIVMIFKLKIISFYLKQLRKNDKKCWF